MASLTVRNIPDSAKLRFRQVAAAHGRSMEEHLRQLVIHAGLADEPEVLGVRPEFVGVRPEFVGVRDVAHGFRHFPVEPPASTGSPVIDRLLRLGRGLELELPPRAPEPPREIDFL